MVAFDVPVIPRRISHCAACNSAFDTMQAGWCSCVTKTISPACPKCGFCLCKATAKASRDFWFRAPQELVGRRRAEEDRRAQRKPELVLQDAKKVLIVDDDEEIRFIADYALRDMGFLTMTAADGQQALALVGSERPHVVLTDAFMPKMDGREVCKQIKLHHPRVKVVVMTSLYTSPRYRTEAYRVFHADDYLAKPIDFARLESTLKRLTNRGEA